MEGPGPRVGFEKRGEPFYKNATDADWWGYGDGGFRREFLRGPKRKTSSAVATLLSNKPDGGGSGRTLNDDGERTTG